ncbi:metallophosphoesterase [Candidatus Gracilibacteria bacterium]|nr:metallophosphoesterase [Candidatus Gracilibacteria bacterium]
MSGRENYWLALVLGVLSLSFVGTTLYASYSDNRKSRYAYFLAAIWLGIVQYLFLTFLGVWGIAVILEKSGIFVSLGLLGEGAMILSGIIALYGILHAKKIYITRVDVSIKNLPDYWEGKRIVHISDVHIGHIQRSPFVRKIVKLINREHPEIVCITGDLFDGMDGKLEHLVDPLLGIESPHGVYYVDGNHETYLGIERAFRSLQNTNVRILRDEIVHIEGINIIGIDYPETGVKKDIAKTICTLPGYTSHAPSILLYHVPEQIKKIAQIGIDLELCGHTHAGQMWPFGYITGLLFEGRDYGITTIGDYSLLTSSGVGTWGPPMRVGSKSEIVVITLHKK